MKRMIFLVMAIVLILSAMIITSSASVSVERYSDVLYNNQDQLMDGNNIGTKIYVGYSDFQIFCYPTNIPLGNVEEGENRDYSVFSQVALPRIVNFGISNPDLEGVVMPSDLMTMNNHYYVTDYGNKATQVSTTIQSVTVTNYGNEVTYAATPSGGLMKRSYFLMGATYFKSQYVGNALLDTAFRIAIPDDDTYTVEIRGKFIMRERGNPDIYYDEMVDYYITMLPDDSRETIDITPQYLGITTASGRSDFMDGVFVGQIALYSHTSSSNSVLFTNAFSEEFSVMCEVNDSRMESGYAILKDPILSYNLSSTDIDYGVLEITQNGLYNVDDYQGVNVNVPQSVGWGSLFDWLFHTMGAFMSFEIAPGWSIGVIMSVVVGIAVAIWAIRVFMGG